MQKGVEISGNLTVDRNIFDFLANTNSLVSAVILNIPTEYGISYISPSDKSDMVSYLPMDKYKEENDPFADKCRSSIKIGRLISKLFTDEKLKEYNITPSHIEDFVNKYKSWFDRSDIEFRIVEGEEIRKWYLEHNYFTPSDSCVGSLWNSCMRYKDRQKFLDLYCKDPNVKMLIMTTKHDGVEKLRARSLLWNSVEVIGKQDDIPPTVKIMDRIYSVFDSDVHTFKKWADQNGYIPKWEQNAKSHQYFDVKGQPFKIKCKLKIMDSMLKYYPYLDTFPFFDMDNGVLYNDEFNRLWMYKLVQANGGLFPPDPEPEMEPEFDDEYFDDEH